MRLLLPSVPHLRWGHHVTVAYEVRLTPHQLYMCSKCVRALLQSLREFDVRYSFRARTGSFELLNCEGRAMVRILQEFLPTTRWSRWFGERRHMLHMTYLGPNV